MPSIRFLRWNCRAGGAQIRQYGVVRAGRGRSGEGESTDKGRQRWRDSCSPTFLKFLVTALALLAAGWSSDGHSATGQDENPDLLRATLSSALSGAWRSSSYPDVLTFEYPRDWHVAPYDGGGSSAATPLVAISNAPIPTAWLARPAWPTSVFAVWLDVGNNGVPFHPNTIIDGRQAQVTMATPAIVCPKRGPLARSISALVVRDPGDFVELWACLPQTELSANTAVVLAIARSLHLTAS